jgi:hypothetical protein
MRRGVVLIGVVSAAVALAAPGADAETGIYWPIPKLTRVLDGARVSVRGGVVRIDSETPLCAGRGTARRVRGARAWRSFACGALRADDVIEALIGALPRPENAPLSRALLRDDTG